MPSLSCGRGSGSVTSRTAAKRPPPVGPFFKDLINAIVATGALPPGLLDKLPLDQITPMSTMVRCFDELADLGEVERDDWAEKGRLGETVEGDVQDLIWHYPPPRTSGQGGNLREIKEFWL
ncbi:hypothetical protein OIDMADRAFT_32881 [Oidiodendron maius Zn]|uniref:Uncharacterized protein n=1 Tax=Oidiodendron maius (strain Zn) TaxID=913774 RepID=A0A0C3H0T3_OIDMZ|nr:hypothetical protein OIDMADRAFT_32881 [Oidiodendron maius Zn]